MTVSTIHYMGSCLCSKWVETPPVIAMCTNTGLPTVISVQLALFYGEIYVWQSQVEIPLRILTALLCSKCCSTEISIKGGAHMGSVNA